VPWLYVGLKLAGAGYLLWLAWKTLRPGGVALFEARSLPRDSRAKLFRMGLLTNLLNPKAAVMYVALIPQFIDPSAGSVMLQGFVLGSIQISVSMLINAAIILVAGSLATFVATRPAWIRRQRKITGTMLGAAGIALAVEARTPATA
ncbi:MAG: LysE family translocator, partial [Pseudonocardiales bacterium]|nr:LysE family translocator [Pseudonocardiales bacterium]